MKNTFKSGLFLVSAFCFLLSAFVSSAQVPTFGTAAAIAGGTPVTTSIVSSNTQYIQMRPSAATLTFTNAATLTLYNIVSLDGVHWVTNGIGIVTGNCTNATAGSPEQTVTLTTNWYAYGTNMPLFVEQIAVVTPAFSTNTVTGSGTYGP